MRHKRGTALVVVVGSAVVLGLLGQWGCGTRSASEPTSSTGTGGSQITTVSLPAAGTTPSTRIEVTTTTVAGQAVAEGLSGFRGDLIPMPFINGGYLYSGYGRFQLVETLDGPEKLSGAEENGPHFFWRDGRFVWADGRLMEVDDLLLRMMEDKDISFPDHQPTLADVGDLGATDLSGYSTELALLVVVRELGGLGWWVRHTYIDSLEPLVVTFSLDETDNGPFVEDILLRAVLRARTRGLAIDSARVEYEGSPGEQPRALTDGVDLEKAAAELWLAAPATPDNDAVRAMIEANLPSPEAYPRWNVRLLEVSSTLLESRRITVWVEVADGDRVEAEAYAAEVLASVLSLNAEKQTGIAVVRVDTVEPGGTPILQARWDLDLGRDSST
ncbi:MAG: hypothetical protein ACYCX3_07135 [Thermoleophilia bacterium]